MCCVVNDTFCWSEEKDFNFFILRVKMVILKCLTLFSKNGNDTIRYFINKIAYVPVGPSLVLRGNPRR